MTETRDLPPVNDPFGTANLAAVPMPAVPTHVPPAPIPGSNADVSAAHDQDHVPAGAGSASTAVDDFNADDYEYVRIGGVVRAIPKSAVQPATDVPDVPKAVLKPVEDPHFYAWLANGTVKRVKQSDLPASAGASAPYGHWQEGDKLFLIVNVYPVEDTVKEVN